jgi:hypothetical protein
MRRGTADVVRAWFKEASDQPGSGYWSEARFTPTGRGMSLASYQPTLSR